MAEATVPAPVAPPSLGTAPPRASDRAAFSAIVECYGRKVCAVAGAAFVAAVLAAADAHAGAAATAAAAPWIGSRAHQIDEIRPERCERSRPTR